MSATLSNHDDIEMFPLRAATSAEGKQLKQCLQAARGAQLEHRRRTGKLASKISELNIDAYCDGLSVKQRRTSTGYEILAEKREDENTVRWSVNEHGVIEEHLDAAPDGELEL
jgi:tRNA isopentenyl-2-thiomethyl-A-37 hydroxylase MiaE